VTDYSAWSDGYGPTPEEIAASRPVIVVPPDDWNLGAGWWNEGLSFTTPNNGGGTVKQNPDPVNGGSESTTPAVASAVPALPAFTPMPINHKSFKVAPVDIIQFDDTSVEIQILQDLIIEDIGSVELANISRPDLIDGQPTIYSPIINLSTIRRDFNPNNLIAVSSSDYFARFGINLVLRGMYEPYFNEDGDLVIEIDTVQDEENIEVEILSNGTISTIEEL
jgi:hypothetical protein